MILFNLNLSLRFKTEKINADNEEAGNKKEYSKTGG